MQDEYLIAYDIGTSGTKASLFSVEGSFIASETAEYPVSYAPGGCAEQDPNDYWQAIVRTTRKLADVVPSERIRALSFSGQMMACLLVDADGNPVRPSIIWADTRAKEEEEALRARLGGERGYRLLGHRISCNYSIEKLMWVRHHEPENYARARKMLQAKDYILFRLTGEFVTDLSDASGTNAYDLKGQRWAQEVFDAAELDVRLMPTLLHSTDVAGRITPEAARELNLPEDVAVVTGGGDGPCSALGAGCMEDDRYFLTFGTSAWIAGTTREPVLDEKQVLFCFAHVIPDRYVPMGTMQDAGSSYAYMRNTFFADLVAQAAAEGRDVYELLNALIAQSPPGAKNLIYLPYLTGERSPRWNPLATASFLGMTMNHTRADYLRATIEGVAMNLAVILQAFREKRDIREMILTGGGAQGDIVTSILADALGCTMVRTDHVKEATSMAAAVIAGVGAGIFDSFEAIHRFVHWRQPVAPDPLNHALYQKRIRVFDDCYRALEGIYPEIKGDTV